MNSAVVAAAAAAPRSLSLWLRSSLSALCLGVSVGRQPYASSNDAQLKTENADAAKTAADSAVDDDSDAVFKYTLQWEHKKFGSHLA